MSLGPMSQTVSAAFTVWYFKKRQWSLDTSVARLLKRIGSRFVLQCVPGHQHWIKLLTVRHLLEHSSGLKQYKLTGFPRSRLMPKPMQMMTGGRGCGSSVKLMLIRCPGTEFCFSDGNFVILQHLIKKMEGANFNKTLRKFLELCGMVEECSFQQRLKDNSQQHATGYYEDGRSVPGGRLMFCALAKGLSGTTRSCSRFLEMLGSAYCNKWCRFPISYAQARALLQGRQLKGSPDSVDCGLGTLLCKAGPNRVMFLVADTDGFRGVYVCCFDGPDSKGGPSGFVVVCNGSGNAMEFICALAKNVLLQLNWEGIDFTRIPENITVNHTDIMTAIREKIIAAFVPPTQKGTKQCNAENYVRPADR